MSPEDTMQLIGAMSDAVEARARELLEQIERLPPGHLRETAGCALVAALLEEAGQVARRLNVPYSDLLGGAVESWSETYGIRSRLTVREHQEGKPS